MDTDWLIVIADGLITGGALIALVGAVTLAWPRSSIGWGARKRAALAALAGLSIAYGGSALHDYRCNPKIPCNRCSANSSPPISTAHACMQLAPASRKS
jgi:hypothetical protein